MAITPQIDNQLNTITSIEQIPSKTYKLNDDILATKKEYLEPTIVESYESITIDDLGDPNIKLEAAGNSTQEVIPAEEGKVETGFDLQITDAIEGKENQLIAEGNSEQEIIEAVAGKTVSGFNLDITDEDLTKENQLTPEGNSVQNTTTGKNQAGLNDIASTTLDGVTYSASNGVLTINNTATNKVNIQSIPFKLTSTTAKYLRVYLDSGTASSDTRIGVSFRDSSNNQIDYLQTRVNDVNGKNLTLTDLDHIYLYVISGSSFSNAKIRFMLSDSQSDTYEPYTYGASPNPSYPQAINSVGDNENLLQNSGTSTTNNDVEFTVNSDGTVIATGTAAPNNALLSIALNKTFPAGIYTLKDCIGYVESDNYTGWFDGTSNNGATKEFTSNFKFTNIYVRVLAGTTVTNKKFYPKLEQGSQATGYSPYNMGSIQIEKCNKNLFDKNTNNKLNAYFSTVSKITSDNNCRMFFIPVLPNTTYTVSKISSTRFRIITTDVIPALTVTGSQYIDRSTNTTATITTNSTAKYLCVFYYNSNTDSLTEQQILDSIQIEYRETATTYIAHQSETYPIYTQAPMRAIGEVRDDFIKQAGVWYERHKMSRVILDGTEEGWLVNGETETFGQYVLSFNKAYGMENLKSDKFITKLTNTENSICGRTTNGNIYITIAKSIVSYSVDDFKTWLSTHNTEVIYVLAEPTLTPCTNEQITQLEALKDMQLYDSYTNITSLDVIQPNLNFHYNFITPSPSPDRESDINSVGDNVNLFDISELSTETINITGTNKEFTVSQKDNNIDTQFNLTFEPNKQYTFSGSYSSTKANGALRITYTDDSRENVIGIFDNSTINKTSFSFTSNASKSISLIEFRLFSNGNFSFYDLKIEEGQVSSYSPYNQGSIAIEKCNKNLLDLAFYENSSSYYTVSENGDIVITANDSRSYSSISDNICLKLKAGSYTFISPSNFERCIVQNKSASGSTLIDARAIKYANFTLVSDSIVFIKLLSTSNNFPVTVEKPMLVYGTITEYPSPYVAHASQTYPIYTQSPMRSIGDVRDDFAKIGGVWYERHKIGRVLLDGTEEGWQRVDNTSYVKFTSNQIVNNCGANKTNLSNYFKTGGNEIGVLNLYANNWLDVFMEVMSLEDFKTWLSTHNTEVIYELAEPTLTPCTVAQTTILNSLKDTELYEETNITTVDVIQANLNLHYNFITPAPSPDRKSDINSVADNNSINITVSNEDETESQSFTITTQQPFRKIGDVFDDFVKTGDTWYERHKIGRILLDGTETDWQDRPNYNDCDRYVEPTIINNNPSKVNDKGFSNYFPINSTSSNSFPYISPNATQIVVNFAEKGTTTLADFKTWLTTHNTEVIYELAEPTLTPCTAAQTEQLEALQNILLTQTPVIINSNDATFPGLKLTYYTKDDIKYITVQTDRIIGFVDNIEAVKQAIYHILMTERYANLIYDENYGIELEQYIGADLEYIQTTIEQTLREALTHDLRILDVKVTSVENIEKDLVLVKFNAYTIYGNLNMEVNINV